MFKRILEMIWLWPHAEEWQAFRWFKSHESLLCLSPRRNPKAYIYPPGGLASNFEAPTLMELRDKCEKIWNLGGQK